MFSEQDAQQNHFVFNLMEATQKQRKLQQELDKATVIGHKQHNKHQDFVDNAFNAHLVPPSSKKAKVGAGASSTLFTLFGVTSVDVLAEVTAAMATTAGSSDTSPKQQRQPFKFPDGLSCLITAEECEKQAGTRKKNIDDNEQMLNKKKQLCVQRKE